MTTTDARRTDPIEVPRGLNGVVAAHTAIGDVRGEEGFYHYRGHPAVELAETRSLEEVWALVLDGGLPDPTRLAAFRDELASARRVPSSVWDALPAITPREPGRPLLALTTAVALLGSQLGMRPLYDADPAERRADLVRLAAAIPTLVAAQHRIARGLEPVEPVDGLGHAANYLAMLSGEPPEPRLARALEQYLIATIDHGFNASTFTARVIASTGSDAASCIVGALGALAGPRHGGAPSRALDAIEQIGAPERAAAWVREQLAAGGRVMGFGHAVYRTEDPRSRLLKGVARSLGGPTVELAIATEERIEDALRELKPGRELHANVEYYAGVVMGECGVPRELFTCTFAAARAIGWSAHVLEQAADGKMIRPSSRYVGPPVHSPEV